MSTSIETQPYMETAIAPMPFEDQLQPTPEAPTATLDRIKDFGRTAIDRFNTLTDHLPTPSRKLTALATTGAIALGTTAAETTPASAKELATPASTTAPTPTTTTKKPVTPLTESQMAQCAELSKSGTEQTKVKISYTNKKHNAVKISLTDVYYKSLGGMCARAGKRSLYAFQTVPDKNGHLKRNTPYGKLNLRPGKSKASIVLPTFNHSYKCTWGANAKSVLYTKPAYKGIDNPTVSWDQAINGDIYKKCGYTYRGKNVYAISHPTS